MNRKILVIISALLVLTLVAGGCSRPSTAQAENVAAGDAAPVETNTPATEADPDKTFKLGIIPMTLNDTFQVTFSNAAKAMAESYGMEVTIQGSTAHTDAEVQLQYIENMIAGGVDAILIAPSATDGLITGIRKCQEAGIVVVNIDARLNDEILEANGLSAVPFCGTNNYQGGVLAGEYVAANYPQGTKTAILLGIEGHDATLTRTQGFIDAAGDVIDLVAQQTADFDVEKGYNATQNIITANPELELIFAISDGMGIGAARAVEEAGKLDQIDVISFDGIPEGLQLVLEGKIKAEVAQHAVIMGETSAEMAWKLLNGEQVEMVVDSGSEIILQDGAAAFMEELERFS